MLLCENCLTNLNPVFFVCLFVLIKATVLIHFKKYFILDCSASFGYTESDSVTYIHISILFQILSPFRLLQNTEQSSLCYK